ncbi:MAG: hypothetical protein CML68_06485 [Rhodobacteraceae bacterium]|nr:hypothetical protein [Paracoccaceae bacterium]
MKIRILDVVVALLAAVTLGEWLSQAVGPWDWDIDHMMYFGDRLLAGEFHWTREFDDKLPVLQILFALPAAVGSVAAWRWMALALMVMGAAATWHVMDDMARRGGMQAAGDRRRYGALAAVTSLYAATFMPGGIHHINAPAAACAITALSLLIQSRRVQSGRIWTRKGRGGALLFAVSAFAASLAIGMRPYFLLPLVLGAGWICLRDTPLRSLVRVAIWPVALTAIWTGLVGAWGLLVNFVPYVALGQTDAFFAGMAMFGQTLNPQTTADTLHELRLAVARLPSPLSEMILLAAAACFYAVYTVLAGRRLSPPPSEAPLSAPPPTAAHRRLCLDTAVLVFCLPALLLLAILQRHFWAHYLQMFSPFLGLGLAVFAVLLRDIVTRETPHYRRLGGGLVLATALIFAVPALLADLAVATGPRAPAPGARTTEAVAAALADLPEDRRAFLFLDDMAPHWRLHAPRHGFPHAANSYQVINLGWWSAVDMPAHFAHPVTAGGYCTALTQDGPPVIFAGPTLSAFAEACLSRSPDYRLHGHINDGRIAVYTR